MTLFDIGVMAILLVSVGLAVWRGLVRELLSLLSWIGSFWIAREFTVIAAGWLPASLTNPGLRLVVAFVGLMLAALLVFSLLTLLLVHLVKVAGLKASDRTLGAFFGLVRGVAIVVVLVLLGGMTTAPSQPFWRDALLSRPLEAVALWVKPWFPDEVGRRVRFE
jgi:membrane protein required for colicin V production